MTILKTIWGELTKADGYDGEWYGYAKNQLAHYILGFTLACVLSQTHFFIFGEFAQKWALWFFVASAYAIFELRGQGWQGKDTLEDWVFFSVYGAGTPIFLFNEVDVGSSVLAVNSQLSVPVILVVYGHLFGGIVSRIVAARGSDD